MKIFDQIKKLTLWVLGLIITILFHQCKPRSENKLMTQPPQLKISLAQWSIHRALDSGVLKAENFAAIAKNDFGINAVEYVNQFYKGHASDRAFWEKMRAVADSLEVKSLVMMVDDEGDLGNPDPEERIKAVENHFKWVDAAHILGCHSIRINAFGEGSKEEVQRAMIDALKELCTYAAKDSINVLIENHGLYSSDGQWIVGIMEGVDMPNVGTLPDFGNWCTGTKWGSIQEGKDCKEEYDLYKGVREILPFARGVSAKSYAFNDQGDETKIDYSKMMQIVKESGFTEYIGIEYEGSQLSERDGIMATKFLLEKIAKEKNAIR
jgi:sugar phosphate isomerase/epimerase